MTLVLTNGQIIRKVLAYTQHDQICMYIGNDGTIYHLANLGIAYTSHT